MADRLFQEDRKMDILSKIGNSAVAVASFFMLPSSLNVQLEARMKGEDGRLASSIRKVSFDELTESVIKGSTRTRAGYSRMFWDFI
jgi:hypothetical protein